MAGKDLAVVPASEYAVTKMDTSNLLETIRANIGGQQLTEFDLDRVKIPSGGGKAWDVPTLEGSELTQVLQGVIVYWKDTRAYWKASFDEQGGGQSPDCSSHDAIHGSGDPGVAGPMLDGGFRDCSGCPMAVFGSDSREGSNAQACKLVRQLFFLTPGDLIPLVVSLPPTSVGEANRYFLRLSRAGVPYFNVITNIALTQEKSGGNITYSRASFSLAARLEGEDAAAIQAYADVMRPTFERTVAMSRDEATA